MTAGVTQEFFKNGGQRVATILMYLSDVEEGGETVFPLTQAWLHPERAKAHDWSKVRHALSRTSFRACGCVEVWLIADDCSAENAGESGSELNWDVWWVVQCASKGVAVKPHAGDALLFWGVQLDGVTLDKASMHAGCPVLKGTKYTATKWIHAEVSSLGDAESSLGHAESLLGDAKSSLGDAESSLGDAEISLGDAESSLGDAESSLGDPKSSLGDAKSSLGDAKSSLGGAESSMGDAQSSG
jgi:hypothetical protein